MIWRSATIAMAVAGVVVLGSLAAIGDWGPCCRLAKPLTGDSTWARPPNPWLSGQAAIPGLAAGSGHKAETSHGDSGGNAQPLAGLLAVKRQGTRGRPSVASGPNPAGDTSQSETPLPPGGPGSPPGDTTSTGNCSPVIDVLAGAPSAGCVPGIAASDHNDSSGNDSSSGDGNHHSSGHHGSSDNVTPLPRHDSHGADKRGKAHGPDKAKNGHGAKSEDRGHGNGRSGGKKHH